MVSEHMQESKKDVLPFEGLYRHRINDYQCCVPFNLCTLTRYTRPGARPGSKVRRKDFLGRAATPGPMLNQVLEMLPQSTQVQSTNLLAFRIPPINSSFGHNLIPLCSLSNCFICPGEIKQGAACAERHARVEFSITPHELY